MSRRSILKLSPLAILLVLPLAFARPAPPVGAPWISLEMPANPMDRAARDAALLVHAYYHDRPVAFPVIGTAEGLVDGERRSVPLEFRKTGRAGVYALEQQWPSEGHWMLNISVEGERAVSLVVELGPDGGVQQERYYRAPVQVVTTRSVRVVSGRLAADRIESALATMAMDSE